MIKPTAQKGEDLAYEYLKKIGYRIIDRNFRIRAGEIDIIAIDRDTLVYVEVKTRKSFRFGLPEEAVTYRKLKFIERAAQFYRLKHQNLPQLERIDVVAIDLSTETPKIRHIKNAQP